MTRHADRMILTPRLDDLLASSCHAASSTSSNSALVRQLIDGFSSVAMAFFQLSGPFLIGIRSAIGQQVA